MSNTRTIPRIEPDECEIASGERIFIHLFRPEDAAGIGRLFHAVYGDSYPVKHFYSPEGLAKALESGENYSVVARTRAGILSATWGFSAPPLIRVFTNAGQVWFCPSTAKGASTC